MSDTPSHQLFSFSQETEEAANFYRSKWDALRNPHPVSLQPIQYEWKPKSHLLTYEEIVRLVRIGVGLGIRKIRLTGGEPLLRRDVPVLVKSLAGIAGIEDIALTTNGFLFARHGEALRAAGLHRVSFSMDSLDPVNFRKLTGRDGLSQVLAAIDQARKLGFSPVKVNAVMIRHLNDHELEDLAAWAHAEELSIRFIEFMPLDSSRAWQRDLVVPGREIVARLGARFNLVPVDQSRNPAETARRWAFPDGRGEVGVIAPVTEPFCGHCNRLRLTADGKIRTCLFSLEEPDLKPLLRGVATDEDLARELVTIVRGKEAGHRIGQPDFIQPARSMSCIGG